MANKILKENFIDKFVIWIGFPFAGIYIFSMLIFPFFEGNGDWEYVQGVWDRWQGLNVGFLAFLASVVAFKVARKRSEDERKRNFRAALAFLPQEFSDLTSYCRASRAVFAAAWPYAEDVNEKKNGEFEVKIPKLPDGYKQVFRDCITFSDNNFGDVLAEILRNLQIHHSRMKGMVSDIKSESELIFSQDLMVYFYRIGEIQALINKHFNYARGLEPLDETPLNLENFQNSLYFNESALSKFKGLEDFIKRAIEKQ